VDRRAFRRKKPAPLALGSADLPVLDEAPGRYVMEK